MYICGAIGSEVRMKNLLLLVLVFLGSCSNNGKSTCEEDMAALQSEASILAEEASVLRAGVEATTEQIKAINKDLEAIFIEVKRRLEACEGTGASVRPGSCYGEPKPWCGKGEHSCCVCGPDGLNCRYTCCSDE